MKTIRNLLLIICAAATLGTLADTDVSATTHSPLSFAAIDAEPLPHDRQQIDVYLEHKAAIDAAWEEVGTDQPLQSAIDHWMAGAAGVQFVTTTSAESAESAVCTSGSCGVSSARAVSSRSSRASPRRFGWRVRRLFGRR